MELDFPSAIVFLFFYIYIELENYGKKTSLLGKPVVQVLQNAEICLKPGYPATHACCYISVYISLQ